MKTKTSFTTTLVAALLLLTVLPSCSQFQPATKAVPFTAHGPVYGGNRYTATWGDPTLVHWVDNANGHRWTCTYKEFFQYCGQKHPSQLGIAVRGKLPSTVNGAAAPAQPVNETTTPAPQAQPAMALTTPCEPAPYQVP